MQNREFIQGEAFFSLMRRPDASYAVCPLNKSAFVKVNSQISKFKIY